MKFLLATVVILLFQVLQSNGNPAARERRDILDGDWANSEWANTVSEKLSCRGIGQPCALVPACCGSHQCYWEHGYNPLQRGVCVSCVDRTLTCQRHSQCCSSLVCQKENRYNINGKCDVKRSIGEPCHSDSQCATNYCDISWTYFAYGEGGQCARLD